MTNLVELIHVNMNPIITNRQIGRNIRSLREMRNFSQQAVAIQLDISQKQFSRIENGEVSISIEIILKICEVLKIELNTLMHFNPHAVFHETQHQPKHNNLLSEEINTLRRVSTLYEKLLSEKDEIIELLKTQIKPHNKLH